MDRKTQALMNLTDLPAELLSDIIDNIDSPADLLSLGLTCRLLLSTTIPYPLEHRRLLWPILGGTLDDTYTLRGGEEGGSARQRRSQFRTGPNVRRFCEAYLAYMEMEPKRGKAVRTLIISEHIQRPETRLEGAIRDLVREQQAKLDRDNTTPLDAEPQQITVESLERHWTELIASVQSTLAQAISYTPFVHTFRWDWMPPSVDGPLWDALSNLTQLKRVSFHLGPRYKIAANPQQQPATAEVIRIATMLEGLPNLENLSIGDDSSQASWDASPILRLRWANLTRLHLESGRCQAEELASFLEAHPTLEDLHLQGYDFDLSAVGVDALPNLKTLAVFPKTADPDENVGFGHPFLQPLSRGVYRPLKDLNIIRLHAPLELIEFRQHLPAFGSTLKTLDVTFWSQITDEDVDWIMTVLPHLVYLALPEPNIRTILFFSFLINRSREGNLESSDRDPNVDEKVILSKSELPQVEKWATRFLILPSLETLFLRTTVARELDQLRGVDRTDEIRRKETDPISVSEVFQQMAPDLELLELRRMTHKGIRITCRRRSA